MEFEEQYEDVLQNLEFGLTKTYDNDPKMNDHAALFVVEQLIKHYNAEGQGRTLNPSALQPHEQMAYDSVKALCEFRLGRQGLVGKGDESLNIGAEAITTEELIACLKRIKKSIEFWQKRGGRKQYYEFVHGFMG
jgi:hypothetical protein